MSPQFGISGEREIVRTVHDNGIEGMMRNPRPGEGRVYGIHAGQGSVGYVRSGPLTGGRINYIPLPEPEKLIPN